MKGERGEAVMVILIAAAALGAIFGIGAEMVSTEYRIKRAKEELAAQEGVRAGKFQVFDTSTSAQAIN